MKKNFTFVKIAEQNSRQLRLGCIAKFVNPTSITREIFLNSSEYNEYNPEVNMMHDVHIHESLYLHSCCSLYHRVCNNMITYF